ncbi:MAG TPA: hypothetical protein VF600_08190 [Abditibacteriaceae bacterium]|jgi:hypothetical protein
MVYQQLDAETQVQNFVPITVQEARLVSGPWGKSLQVERETQGPTIPGVEIIQAQTFSRTFSRFAWQPYARCG